MDQAEDTASRLNNLADLVMTLRNDAQDEIVNTVNNINSLLDQIASLNADFRSNNVVGRSTAFVEDQRDNAVKELTELIDISFFTRGDGVMVIQTNQGQELVNNIARPLTFSPTRLSADSYYPENVAGVFVSDPTTDPAAVDITALMPGGKLGGLLELRDEIFPKQTAQLDELAHKLAYRFDQQGLRLFTDASGNVPADTAPDPTITPPATTPDATVSYIGFAQVIQVNAAVMTDNTLIQRGTVATDNPIPIASSEVINRVLEFTFGDADFQQALGVIDLRASLVGDTLQEWLGVFSSNQIVGTSDLTGFVDPDGVGGQTSVDQLIAASGGLLTGTSDFSITFSDARLAGTNSFTITISLNNVAAESVTGTETLADLLVAEINDQIDNVGIPGPPVVNPLLGTVGATPIASIGPSGQIVLDTRGSVEIDATNAPNVDPMGSLGLGFLGLAENIGDPQAPIDPYFDIKVGSDDFTRIFIEPGDDESDLLDKLNLAGAADALGVPSLAVDDATLTSAAAAGFGGFLNIRPGDDYVNPSFGGSIQIVSGPFTVNAALATINAQPAPGPGGVGIGAGTLANGINLVSALFGSFNAGAPPTDSEPVTGVNWGSETDATATPPIPTLPFRQNLLGPGANVSTGITNVSRLTDFSQRIVNQHTQELVLIQNQLVDEESLRDALQTRLSNESAVNIDVELGNLVMVQTAFSASARVVSAVDELFDELLSAF